MRPINSQIATAVHLKHLVNLRVVLIILDFDSRVLKEIKVSAVLKEDLEMR